MMALVSTSRAWKRLSSHLEPPPLASLAPVPLGRRVVRRMEGRPVPFGGQRAMTPNESHTPTLWALNGV